MNPNEPRKEKRDRKFTQELFSLNLVTPLTEKKCALQVDKSCCHGLGYKISVRGAYAFSELCRCVEACERCLGKAQKVENGFSKPCRLPSPKKVTNLLNDAFLPARYAYADFSTFSNFSGNCRAVVQKLRSWERNFSEKEAKGVLISGPVGVGKTFLLACIAKSLIQRGFSVKFVDFFQLLTEIKAGFSDQKPAHHLIDPLIAVDVLIVDELGKGRNTDFEKVLLDQLIMGRYNQQKAIIASTNYVLNEAKVRFSRSQGALDEGGSSGQFDPEFFSTLESRIGARIFSRLVETTVTVEMEGNDFRRMGEQRQ